MFRLEQACERLKNILTVNPEAPISVENIMNDVDVKSAMSRDKFEELSAPLFERVGRTIQRALEEAGVSVEQLNTVELVGGASRIPKVTLACQEALGGRELKSTMNKSECVALGAALQCAMLSPHCMVRDLSIQDCYPYSVKVEWGFSNSADDVRVDDS
jgi:heat shock protein 4